ncbi:hypothetical protein H4R20_000024 [Coemansia guatemalensis]|uniref:Protein kinase domain-containing protein n=1 Tax=Coemansia guatemalensis TaxID=2761395 RepID=A0A9W8I700_9FUNG|nr:hypothetical protein H4R20_000024 [Coemansia guatemalensis]
MFVRFSHSLLKANAGDGKKFLLHWDIPTGNLLITQVGKPQVIDWGCGLVVSTDSPHRQPSAGVVVGTASYMGCRVLMGEFKHSVIDDFVLLFLVYSANLAEIFGTPDSSWQQDMWGGYLEFTDLLGK